MTHVVELKEDTARFIEADAAAKGLTPEEFIAGAITRMAHATKSLPTK